MKRTIAAITAIVMTVAPTSAFAGVASIRLMLNIPVRCSLDVVGGSVVGNALILEVYRNCNTGHEVVLSGLHGSGLDDVSVSYNGGGEAVAGDQFSLSQSERYYDQTDYVVIEAADASAEDMRALAGSLTLSVVVA